MRRNSTDVASFRSQKRWDEPPNPARLRLTVHDRMLCNKVAVSDAISDWMQDLGYQRYSLPSGLNTLSATWSLIFSGADVEGDRRARKAIQTLKLPNDEFTRRWVCLPAEPGEELVKVQLYISFDKSDKDVATEIAGKRLREAFAAVHPQLDCHLLKRDGILCIGWERAVKVVPHADKKVELLWIQAVVDKKRLSKAEIQDKFNMLCTAGGMNLPWRP